MSGDERRAGARIGEGLELVARLDDHGAGEAWKARDPDFRDRLSLIKVLAPLPEARSDPPPALVELARRLRAVRHAALLPVTGVGMIGARPFVTSTWFDGASLLAALRGARVQTSAIARSFDALCEAVHACHGAGVVHGRITPGCVLARVDRGGLEVRLTDFGLMPLCDQGTAAAYADCAAPEEPSTVADVFALGATLRRALAASDGADEWVEPIPGFRGRDDVPTAVWEIIERATAQTPQDRPADAALLREGLDLAWRDAGRLPVKRARSASPPEEDHAVPLPEEVAPPPPIWSTAIQPNPEAPTTQGDEPDDARRTTFQLPSLPGVPRPGPAAQPSAPTLDELLGATSSSPPRPSTSPTSTPPPRASNPWATEVLNAEVTVELPPRASNPWATEVLNAEVVLPNDHAPTTFHISGASPRGAAAPSPLSLDALVAAPGASAPSPSAAPVPPSMPTPRRPPWALPLVAVGLLAALAVAAAFLR